MPAESGQGTMTEAVSGHRLFHVTRRIAYNPYAPVAIGAEFEVGAVVNPFFGFYEGARTYRVSTPDGPVTYGALHLLREVGAGRVTHGELATTAADVVQHYVMLVRELIMEEVRREVASHAPSRQRCLWATSDLEQARRWKGRLGGSGRILEIAVTGTIFHADASLLLGDSEPLSVTYDRARRYWHGERTETPEPECLVAGRVATLAECC